MAATTGHARRTVGALVMMGCIMGLFWFLVVWCACSVCCMMCVRSGVDLSEGGGDGGGVHGTKTTDPRPSSSTSPSLLGWASVSEKSAEVVAPEK